MSEFAAPGAAGGSFTVSDHLGHLLIIEVEAHETGVVTTLGEKDAIRATIHDVDAQETIDDALIFPKVLVSSLKGRVGQKVLGVLGQGVAKPGQSAPWVLNDASADPAAAARATAYLAALAAGQFSAPEVATPAPAPAAPAAAAPPQVDLTDPNVVAALAQLAAQQK